MTTLEALFQFVKNRNEPHLVIQKPDLNDERMQELGFEKQGDNWIISREDAKKTIERLESPGVDYEEHHRQERERDWNWG